MQFIVPTRIAVTDQRAHRGRYAPVPPVLLSKMKLFQVGHSCLMLLCTILENMALEYI